MILQTISGYYISLNKGSRVTLSSHDVIGAVLARIRVVIM